jgi:fatty-acyl-CoA synthase
MARGERSSRTADLHAYCRTHLAANETPATWIFTDEFPLTASGKIRKNILHGRLGN